MMNVILFFYASLDKTPGGSAQTEPTLWITFITRFSFLLDPRLGKLDLVSLMILTSLPSQFGVEKLDLPYQLRLKCVQGKTNTGTGSSQFNLRLLWQPKPYFRRPPFRRQWPRGWPISVGGKNRSLVQAGLKVTNQQSETWPWKNLKIKPLKILPSPEEERLAQIKRGLRDA